MVNPLKINLNLYQFLVTQSCDQGLTNLTLKVSICDASCTLIGSKSQSPFGSDTILCFPKMPYWQHCALVMQSVAPNYTLKQKLSDQSNFKVLAFFIQNLYVVNH